MLFKRATAIAALLSASYAFLLPPEITAADKDVVDALSFDTAVVIHTRVMEINCPGCFSARRSKTKMHEQETPSMLKLNFTISHDDKDQLLLNDLPIYPIDHRLGSFMQPLTAPLMAKKKHDEAWAQVSTPKLGYSLSVHHPVVVPTQDQVDLVAIHLDIFEVGDKFLGGIPAIDIKILETSDGKLMIGDADIAEPKSQIDSPSENDRECTTLLCKWRAIIADRLSSLKSGCGRKARPEAVEGSGRRKKPHTKGHGEGHGHHGRPGAIRPFRHHHRHNNFARILKGIVLHVFIPVLIGIMVGITASLVGMVAGHVVIFVWRTVFRRGEKQQYEQVKQQDTKEEAQSLVAHQGPPPEYEEAVVGEKTEQ